MKCLYQKVNIAHPSLDADVNSVRLCSLKSLFHLPGI